MTDSNSTTKRSDKDAERQISLLAALLIRYPDIATVRVIPSDGDLKISFLLHDVVENQSVEEFVGHLDQALAALSILGGEKTRRAKVEMKEYDEISTLEVSRDLQDLSADEFPVLLGMVREHFGNRLIVEGETQDSDFIVGEEFSLGHSLDDFRASESVRHLIGFRDDGRVLVFNQA